MSDLASEDADPLPSTRTMDVARLTVARWSQLATRPPGCWVVSLSIAVLAWATLLTYDQVWFGLNHPPATSGDEPDYDALGWSLSHGRGFSIDTTEAAFRAPYDQAAKESSLYELSASDRGLVTYRPPLYPAAIALIDLVFGRQFWAIRAFDAGCLALACGLMFWALLRRGIAPALIGAFLFVVIDVRTRLYGRAILTEAMSVLWVTILLVMILTQRYRSTFSRTALAGAVFALAVLTRSLFILWAPGLVVLWAWNSAGYPRDLKRGALHGGLFILAVSVVLMPWMMRNITLLGTWMPLGTQGSSQLPAAFSDYAWNARGGWTNLDQVGFYDGVSRAGMTPLEWEKASAELGRRYAWEWIRLHPFKSIALLPMKVWQEVRPRHFLGGMILLLAITGWCSNWHDAVSRVGLGFVCINAFAIALTWSVEGRFLVPLLAIINYEAALGAWWLLTFRQRWRAIPLVR